MADILYKVTGVLTTGKRFKPIVTENYHHAMGINLYRGSVWVKQASDDNKWRLIKRVYN